MKLNSVTDLVRAYKKHGSLKAIARNGPLSYRGVRQLYVKAVEDGKMDKLQVGAKNRGEQKAPKPVIEGRVKALPTPKKKVPKKGVHRYILTSAQNNSKTHKPLWENLQALAKHYNAEIHIARFTYVKSGLGARGDKALVTKKETLYGGEDLIWNPEFTPHLSDERLEIAPGLVWCGEMNILPTAARPLSGLESYTGRSSGIFPHVKISMESVPSMQNEPAKYNYTTGTVTLRNYIQRKAGLKAEFHHCYGATLVEVSEDGNWFVRQINADSGGVINDLDVKVDKGVVTTGNRVHAINWGDVHVEELDPVVRELAWGEGGILDTLKPQHQFLHDVIDFRRRSHHEMKDPHLMFKKFQQGKEDVSEECKNVGDFLNVEVYRDWCKNIVVDSNHHDHIGRWLREQSSWRNDPINARFWLKLQSAVYDVLAEDVRDVNYLRLAIECTGVTTGGMHFLDPDQSYIICHDRQGGIECGMHGHNGPNGSRGSARSFAKMSRKSNVGHSHQAGIYDGVYTAGTMGLLAPEWVKGPSSWSHSIIVTHDNGKRQIVTVWNGGYRA